MANHVNIGHLLLLFILLISAVGCYSAFSKQVPEEEGLSKLKMSSRNLKGTRFLQGVSDDSDSDTEIVSDFLTVFGSTRQHAPYYIGLIRQMCKGTSCENLDDVNCKNAGMTPNAIDTTPICGICDVMAKKCTFDEAKPENEVLAELESKEDNTETTEVLPETTEDITEPTQDTNQL